MELRTLKYFLVVAREGSMTKAAKYLHVTQPTLSVQLKALEDELGKQLFIRSNYNIKLTEEGLHLKKRAEDIFDLVDKTENEMKSFDDISGHIYIGSSESINVMELAKVLKKFQDQYPQVIFDIFSGDTKLMEEKISSGLMDFAIITQPTVDLTKYNYLTIPKKDVWGVLMLKSDPLASKERIALEDIINRPLIVARQAIKEDLPKWFGENLEKIKIAATFDLLYNASLLVKAGLGIAISFDGLANTSKESDLCYRPLTPRLETDMYIIWRKHSDFTTAGKLLLDELKTTFK